MPGGRSGRGAVSPMTSPPVSPFSPNQVDWTSKARHEGASLAQATPILGTVEPLSSGGVAAYGEWDKMPLKVSGRDEFLSLPIYEQMRELSKSLRSSDALCMEVRAAFRDTYAPSSEVARVQQEPQFSSAEVIHAAVERCGKCQGTELAGVLQIICVLARNANNQTFMEQQQGVVKVFEVVKEKMDRNVIYDGLRAMINLTAKGEGKDALVKLDANLFVLDLLRRFPDDPEILQEATRLLRNLTLHGVYVARQIAQHGGIQLVIDAMESHADNLPLQQVCCAALCNIAVHDGNKLLLVELGALRAVTNAMLLHPADVKLQQEACRTLGNLAAHASNKEKIAQSDALERVLAALERLRNEPRLVEMACRCLAYVAANPENQSLLAEKGVVGILLGAATCHAGDARVQEHAIWGLCNLASLGNNKTLIAEQGAIPTLFSAMKTHGKDRRVQQEVLRMICNLGANADNRTTLTAMGGVKAVLGSMVVHGGDARVQLLGCWAISTLKRHNPVAKDEFRDNGGREIAMAALERHGGDPEVKSAARRLLQSGRGREWPAPNKAKLYVARIGLPLLILAITLSLMAVVVSTGRGVPRRWLRRLPKQTEAALWSFLAILFVLMAKRAFK